MKNPLSRTKNLTVCRRRTPREINFRWLTEFGRTLRTGNVCCKPIFSKSGVTLCEPYASAGCVSVGVGYDEIGLLLRNQLGDEAKAKEEEAEDLEQNYKIKQRAKTKARLPVGRRAAQW